MNVFIAISREPLEKIKRPQVENHSARGLVNRRR